MSTDPPIGWSKVLYLIKASLTSMAKEVESLVGAAAGDGGGNEYLYSQQEQNALGGMHQDSSQHTRRHNM